MEGKFSKFFWKRVYLVTIRINRYPRSSSQFHKCWWPLLVQCSLYVGLFNFSSCLESLCSRHGPTVVHEPSAVARQPRSPGRGGPIIRRGPTMYTILVS